MLLMEKVEAEKTYGVVVLNTGVDDVRAGAGARTVVVGVVGAAGFAVRDAAETPGGVALRDVLVDADDGILLDVLDLVSGERQSVLVI